MERWGGVVIFETGGDGVGFHDVFTVWELHDGDCVCSVVWRVCLGLGRNACIF